MAAKPFAEGLRRTPKNTVCLRHLYELRHSRELLIRNRPTFSRLFFLLGNLCKLERARLFSDIVSKKLLLFCLQLENPRSIRRAIRTCPQLGQLIGAVLESLLYGRFLFLIQGLEP